MRRNEGWWEGGNGGTSNVKLGGAPAGAGYVQEADRAYSNATIYTVDREFSTASALAVKGGEWTSVEWMQEVIGRAVPGGRGGDTQAVAT